MSEWKRTQTAAEAALLRLIGEWQEAVAHENGGMGSATSTAAVDDAWRRVEAELDRNHPKDIAKMLHRLGGLLREVSAAPSFGKADALALIGRAIVEAGGVRALARRLKVSPTHVSDLRDGKRSPGPRLARYFGFRVVHEAAISYERLPTPEPMEAKP